MKFKSKHRVALLVLGTLGIGLYACDRFVARAAAAHIIGDINAAEAAPAALVLGTSKRYGDSPNVFFYARLEAATELYEAGKVKKIILSGSGLSGEPKDMQDAMRAMNVPATALILDGEGFRTIDSIRRAKQVYGFDRVIVVSQKFHIERALFLAQHFGLGAQGYPAVDAPFWWALTVRCREVFARARAVWDVASR